MKQLSDALFPGARVFVPGVTGESALLLDELAADPERANGVHFIGIHFPGIGRADYLGLHPKARQTAFFMTPSVRAGMGEQRAELLALDYPGIVRHLEDCDPFDVAFAQLSLPNADGFCSTGMASDFLPLAWPRAARKIGHINPQLPRTSGTFRVHIAELDATVEADAPLLQYDESRASELEQRIGAHVASLVRDGDTLQFGIGSVPAALTHSLATHRRLRLYTGMVSNVVRVLWDAGALDRDARITTGVALGSNDFYRFVSDQPSFWFTDVGRTHDPAAVAAIPRFIAINSAVEVDLLGQVNSERVDGALTAGAGGLPAFARGALQSAGGRSLICMAATAKRGTISRIVPELAAQAVCTLPRYLADVVVTEHGVAELRGRSLEARAQALIGIAAPDHRASLSNAWDAIRARL
jgi:acyl-CoA hydrolase